MSSFPQSVVPHIVSELQMNLEMSLVSAVVKNVPYTERLLIIQNTYKYKDGSDSDENYTTKCIFLLQRWRSVIC